MEYLSNVLIKESTPQGADKVFIVNNLPKNLLYTKGTKMVCKKDSEGYFTGDVVPSPTGEQEEKLLDGLTVSEHDQAIVFNVKRRHVADHLANIDRYVDRMFPRDIHPPERVHYAQKPGDMMSSPIPRNKIPVVDIPLPENSGVSSLQDSPTSKDVPAATAPTSIDLEAVKAAAVAEYKRTLKVESLKKARAVRQAKIEAKKATE